MLKPMPRAPGLLDVGCATGGHLRSLRNHLHGTGHDNTLPTIEQAGELQVEFGIGRVDELVSKFEESEAGGGEFVSVRPAGNAAENPASRSFVTARRSQIFRSRSVCDCLHR